MAGDWIKMRTDLADDPAVISIAETLQIEEDAVIGKLYKVWSWANRQLRFGNASVTILYVDRIVFVTGFAHAMVKAGWLAEEKDGISFPNWDRHNSQSAKTRALTLKRVRNARVTQGALPEKRREEKRLLSKESNTKSVFVCPTLQEVSAYCTTRGNKISADEFIDFYTARGWKFKTGQPMKDWQAAVRTWEKREQTTGKPETKRDLVEECFERRRIEKMAKSSPGTA